MRRWRGVIIPEACEAVDGRTVGRGATWWDGAILVVPQGSADVWREGDDVWGEGGVADGVDPAWRPEADLAEQVVRFAGGGVIVFEQARLRAVTFGDKPAWPDLPFEWLS